MKVRKFFKEVFLINSLGKLSRIEIEGKQYSGLLVDSLFKKEKNHVTLTIIGSYTENNQDNNITKIVIPLDKFENPKLVNIFQWRDLIDSGQNYQFIPVDDSSRLTFNPKKIKRIKKVTNFELENLMEKYTEG
ncbi:MAG: hypothetical protein WDZ80_03885 [Candidatus Paceibacterota bacterium]